MRKIPVIISIALIILLTAISTNASESNPNISYSISLNKSSFLPMEPIIVISKLKNIGNQAIEVNEPCAPKFIVTYDLYRIEPNSLVQITGKIMDHPAGPYKFILEPNEICEGSSELHLTNSHIMNYPGLLPGEYIVKAAYHFKKYLTLNYDKDIAVSEVKFRIEQRDAEQERIFEEFSESLNDISKLSSFYEKYPNSPYRQYILEQLDTDMFHKKDYNGEIRIYKEMLKGQLSTYRRERIVFGTADTYLQLGDVSGAIKFLSDEKTPFIVQYRKQLEEGKIPPAYKDVVEDAKNSRTF